MIRPGRMTCCSLLAALLALCLSCSDKEQEPGENEAAEADVARVDAEHGPVKVILEVAPREPRLSDNPVFTLSIEAEDGVDVELPAFGDSLGDFIIRGFRDPLVEKRNGRRLLRRIYELEPVRTGEHLIYPMVIPFVDSRPGQGGKERMVETEGLTIDVKSVLGEAVPALAGLNEPEAPRQIPSEPFDPLWLLLGLVVVPAGAVFFILRRRRKTSGEKTRVLTPEEQARLDLERLAEAGYLEREAFQDFYRELTGIVRRFIERTTAIRAPELTTEEFLSEIGRQGPFNAAEQDRLQAFLEAADLVKFAALRPGRREIEASFSKAGAFIGLGEKGDDSSVPELPCQAAADSPLSQEEAPA